MRGRVYQSNSSETDVSGDSVKIYFEAYMQNKQCVSYFLPSEIRPFSQ